MKLDFLAFCPCVSLRNKSLVEEILCPCNDDETSDFSLDSDVPHSQQLGPVEPLGFGASNIPVSSIPNGLFLWCPNAKLTGHLFFLPLFSVL